MPNLLGTSFGHDHSTPPVGLAIEPVSREHKHRYNIKVRVTRTHTHKFNRVIKVTNSPRNKTHKYNISGKVFTIKTHRWNAGGRIKKSRTHKYRIIAKIVKSKTHKYTVRIKVTALPRTHKYNVIAKIVRYHVHKYNSGGLIKPPAARTHKFDILERIVPTKTHKWNILTPKIVTTDLQYYKSSNTANSLGGAIDTNSPITTDTLHNIFDVITATQSTNGVIEFRCVYVRNNEARSTLTASKVWLETGSENSNTTISIGLGTSAIDGTEQTIANEEAVPVDVSFTSLIGLNNALSIGNLTHGQFKALWIKREVAVGSSAYDNDNFTIGFAGDTYDSN